jgi:predicted alpha/beta superfamily hydrolase
MELIKRYQVRGVSGEVTRVEIAGRIVDFWIPRGATQHLLIAHDGQNVFDGKTSTHRRSTWEMAQSSIRVSEHLGITPPAIIAIWHGSNKQDEHGRAKDLSPQRFFQEDVVINLANVVKADLGQLRGDQYLNIIFDQIVPEILNAYELEIPVENRAMIGSSMGGLSTLYAGIQRPEQVRTLLALSPHWTIGGNRLVERTIEELPKPGTHRVWMSRGTKSLDADYKPFQELADRLMKEKGYRVGHDFSTKVYEKTSHNERSWASYLDQPIKFWLELN